MLGRQLKSVLALAKLKHKYQVLQRCQHFQNLNVSYASQFCFSTTEQKSSSNKTDKNIEWQIKQLNSTKNKEKYFQQEIVSSLQNLDSNIVQELLRCIEDYSLNKLSLINLLQNSLFKAYKMNDLEIKYVQQIFKESSNPSKLNEYLQIVEFLMDEQNEEVQKILQNLEIRQFQKDFNKILIEKKDDVELNQIIKWIKFFQQYDQSTDMNGIINEKAFDELYDYNANEWLEILKIYKKSGNIDIELLQQMDKALQYESELLYEDSKLFCKYIQICASKDFKPSKVLEYQQQLKKIIIENKKLIATSYLETVQFFDKEYVQSVFTELKSVTSTQNIENSIQSKDILIQFGVIPDPYADLKVILANKNNDQLYNYILKRINEKSQKEHALQIEELFLITKYIYETSMMKRNSDFKNLNLPNIITEKEQKILDQMMQIVNRFMKEKAFKKVNSLKQFLEVSCISYFMGFIKQQQECYDALSPQYLKQFQSVFIFPLIIQFGKYNNELLFNLIPTYSQYIVNKYITRNQLTLNEALQIMKNLHEIKDVYIDQNAKYHYKEFIYGVKAISRLVISTFQMRIYANYNDIKQNKKAYENFFMEQKETKWETQKEKIEISQDLTQEELNQLLQVFYLANDMNIGSKQFYDSMEQLVVQYYDKFDFNQKALATYIISTLEVQNEDIEKKVEQTIQSSSDFSLEQAVQFLSYLTARYSLNEDLWKKLINIIQREDNQGKILQLKSEYKISLYLSRECLLLEQGHISFPMNQESIDHLKRIFDQNQLQMVSKETAFTEAIQYFLNRMGYFHETNQQASIFRYQFSKLDENNLIIAQDKFSFIGDTKTLRSYSSVMIRMLMKKNYKLKIFNVYDWASKEKRSEKIAYFRSKVKGMSYDPEKQKKKTYFNF
ncbi:hypothetical protein TTHERM_00522980 (macronuclear) [Tetrahymena thermophila SB210]|uniref:Uncharacterized protein n=1 Tax=Tetrahymena thermophila (strain SB210) TaxID=312017 RepID=I7MIT1_TETTS|nr:hypothetical protein TTHERM_00522980 [Tetrahymena thermophila SB210]EAR94231.2 hypothetical protein TTHERM_00522980 [Tetrahymena thermophila SB210]|eukprot:XP_001014476.2 hypothetical protein TTHERM_00522980 [Tetrahymena thermophila SB210]